MKARIRSAMYALEFSGSPAIWNDFLRPLIGGPRAPDESPEPEVAAAPGGAGPRSSDAARPVLSPGPLRPAPLGVPSPLSAGAGRPYPDDAYDARRYEERGPQGRGRGDRAFEQRRDADRGGARPPQPPAQRPRRVRPQPTGPQIEKTADPDELYARLGEVEGRRGEKDAVLAAVWFASDGNQRAVTAEEVEKHLAEHGWDGDVRVRPHLQKHVTRSKTLDAGEEAGTFRVNRKGTKYVLDMLVGE